MTALTACLLAVAATGLGLYATAWLVTVRWSRAGSRRTPAADLTGVTILKPLCGFDEDLEANLRSFFLLEHEPLQLVFGAADAGDPALDVVRRLALGRRAAAHAADGLREAIGRLHDRTRAAGAIIDVDD